MMERRMTPKGSRTVRSGGKGAVTGNADVTPYLSLS